METTTTYRRKSKLGTFMLVGGLLGAAVSLFDRGTRTNMMQRMSSTKDGSVNLYNTVKNDPSSVTSYIKQKADNIKMAAQEISQDLSQMADKMNGVTNSSKQAYQYAMEAGSEISEIASKLRHPMQATALNASSTASLPSTMTSGTTNSTTTNSTSVDGVKMNTSTNQNSSSFGSMNQQVSSTSTNSTLQDMTEDAIESVFNNDTALYNSKTDSNNYTKSKYY